MSNLLEKKIAVFDLETTGLGFSAGIVEVAYAIFSIRELLESDKLPKIVESLISPGVPIEQQAQKVHGISEEDVMFSPSISQVWKTSMGETFNSIDYLSGYNSEKFDIPLLNACLKREGIEDDGANAPSLDVFEVYKRLTGNRQGKLVDVAESYGFSYEDQHRAGGDVKATMVVLKALINEYSLESVFDVNQGTQMPTEVDDMAKMYREKKLAIEALNNDLKTLKEGLLDAMGDEAEMVTPFLTIKTSPGRKTIDYKKLIGDLGLNEDEIVPYTKTGKESKVIRLK